MITAYADNLAIDCRGVKKAMLNEVEKVNRCSEDARIQLTTSKREVVVFSNDTVDGHPMSPWRLDN